MERIRGLRKYLGTSQEPYKLLEPSIIVLLTPVRPPQSKSTGISTCSEETLKRKSLGLIISNYSSRSVSLIFWISPLTMVIPFLSNTSTSLYNRLNLASTSLASAAFWFRWFYILVHFAGEKGERL